MESDTYSLDELVRRLKDCWPDAQRRTIHFYASKGIIRGRKRGRGAKYSDEDLLRLQAAVKMRQERLSLGEIARRLEATPQDQPAGSVAHSESTPVPGTKELQFDLQKLGTSCTVQITQNPNLTSWTRLQLADGIELSVRADQYGRLPQIVTSLSALVDQTAAEKTSIAIPLAPVPSAEMPSLQHEGPRHEKRDERAYYRCYLANGRLVAEIDNQRVLIDTGAEFTFGNSGALNICGQRIEFPTTAPQELLTTQSISELIGVAVSVCLGAGVLNRFDYIIDLSRNQLIVGEKIDDVPGISVPLTFAGEVPTIKVQLREGPFSFVVASGARLSLIESSLASHYPEVGNFDESRPLVEKRAPTKIHAITLQIGPREIRLKFGVSPPLVEEYARSHYGAAGQLGAELFHQGALLFSKRRNLLTIS